MNAVIRTRTRFAARWAAAGAVVAVALSWAAPAQAVAPVAPYAALGDSYASGEGAGPFDTGTDTTADGCHRSASAYPRRFAALNGVPAGAVAQVACSGAMLADLYRADHAFPSERAQLDALSAQTRTVTVTVGGNDVGFAAVMAQCVATYWQPWVQDCQQYYTQNDANNVDRKIDGVRPALLAAYRDIQSHAPNAAVWVVTYPRLFAGSCPLNGAPVRAADTDWLNTEADHLSRVIVSAAQEAGVAGVADEHGAFAGHELCSAVPWLNGYTWTGTPLDYTSASFHPNAAGYGRMATDLSAAFSRTAV
jgi:lysophospholipase L1-like esterase